MVDTPPIQRIGDWTRDAPRANHPNSDLQYAWECTSDLHDRMEVPAQWWRGDLDEDAGGRCDDCIRNEVRATYGYDRAQKLLRCVLKQFRIIAGDDVGSSIGWQGETAILVGLLRRLADVLEAAIAGHVEDPPLVFPSPDDL